jgi:hypothetical protein
MSTAGAEAPSPVHRHQLKSSQRSLNSLRSPASFGRAQEHQSMHFSSKFGWLKVFEGKKRTDTPACYKGPSARKEKGRLQLTAHCEQGSNVRILQVEWRLPEHDVSTGQKRFPEHNGCLRRGLLC